LQILINFNRTGICHETTAAVDRRLPNRSAFSKGTTNLICWIYGLARPIFGGEPEEATFNGESK
jgi:hypothetical protein